MCFLLVQAIRAEDKAIHDAAARKLEAEKMKEEVQQKEVFWALQCCTEEGLGAAHAPQVLVIPNDHSWKMQF